MKGVVQPIIRMGHPVLRQKARELSNAEIQSDATKQLVRDMFATLASVGGIGLAAPQIARGVRVIILDVPESRAKVALKDRVLYNPRMEYPNSHQTIEMWEGCLSVPGLRGRTKRYNEVIVTYQNDKCEQCRVHAKGYIAGVFQHEFDHLDGKLYIDTLVSPSSLFFTEEWQMFHKDDAGITGSGEYEDLMD